MSRSAMTQAEMVTEVANIIGRDQTSLSVDQTTTYSDRIKQYLYWSMLTMSRIYAFPELDAEPIDYTLTTETYRYTFATLGLTRLRQIMGITIMNGLMSWKMDQLLFRRFELEHPLPSVGTSRQSEVYAIQGRSIEIWPRPNKAYGLRIRYNQFPEDFASSAATAPFEYKDDVIIAGAVVHAFLGLQENDDAEKWAKVFAGRMKGALGPVQDDADWEPEGRAFDFNTQRPTGDFWANPLVYFNP